MTHAAKLKENLTRLEAVQKLRLLANELEEGTVYLDERAFPVPDAVSFEIEADNHEIEVELKWKAPGAHPARR